MHGFPLDFEIEGLIGSDLQQICIGKYDVQFRFGSGTTIALQSEARINENEERVGTWNEQNGWDSLSFQTLLNCSVISYEVLTLQLLRIHFDNKLTLELLDNSDQYESVQIYPAGRSDQIIVV